MKQGGILFFLVIIFVGISNAQQSQQKIEKELEGIQKGGSKASFTLGEIYLNNDTISTQLLNIKGKKKQNHFLFCIAKLEESTVYLPTEILGYKIGADTYLSYSLDGNNFFIKQIKEGKINLYERYSIPGDEQFTYYLMLPITHDLCAISPYSDDNIKTYHFPDANRNNSMVASQTFYVNSEIHPKFQSFINQYLKDCSMVVNMVNAGYYGVGDLPNIVERYNHCGE